MSMQRERPDFSTISGTMMQLGARDTIAIYLWDDLSWVAHFRDGCGELSDAATWFRANAELLRSRRVGRKAAIETVTMLTPEMIAKIGHLHRRTEARRPRRAAASMAALATFGRVCRQIASGLRRWSVRLIHRAG